MNPETLAQFSKDELIALILAQADSYTACLKGISILSQAYFSLGEREIGCKSALRLLAELHDTGTTNAEHKARLLAPKDAADRPEQLWTELKWIPDLGPLVKV